MSICRKCSLEYERKEWQIKKWDHFCSLCMRAKKKAYREKRKADGRPILSTKMPMEYHLNYKRLHKRDPQKQRAGSMARNAVRSGKLVKMPCEVCGSTKVEMHHPDYTKPLLVQWLCKSHHEDAHHKTKVSAA